MFMEFPALCRLKSRDPRVARQLQSSGLGVAMANMAAVMPIPECQAAGPCSA
jgi:hypothetical protein